VRQHPELAGGYFDFFERYAARFGIGEEFAGEVGRGHGRAAKGMRRREW